MSVLPKTAFGIPRTERCLLLSFYLLVSDNSAMRLKLFFFFFLTLVGKGERILNFMGNFGLFSILTIYCANIYLIHSVTEGHSVLLAGACTIHHKTITIKQKPKMINAVLGHR